MLTLNKENGEVNIGDIVIYPTFNVSNIECLKEKYTVLLSVKNAEYISFIIRDINDGEYSMYLQFRNEKLWWISIGLGIKYSFPAFVITEEEKIAIKNVIATIGGENTYSWGDVLFNEDPKGGSVSIIINYGN